MSRFATLLFLISASVSVATCSKTERVSDVTGSGFELLHPSTDTRKFIVSNDLEFAKEVAAHNDFCKTQPGCKK